MDIIRETLEIIKNGNNINILFDLANVDHQQTHVSQHYIICEARHLCKNDGSVDQHRCRRVINRPRLVGCTRTNVLDRREAIHSV